MPYADWIIDWPATKQEYGYTDGDLDAESRKPVKLVCSECGVCGIRKYKDASRPHRCKSVIDNKKKCFKCKSKLDISLFNLNRSTSDGLEKVCKQCYSLYSAKKYAEKNKRVKDDFQAFLKSKLSNIKSRAKSKRLDFDLTEEYFIQQYESQKGLCYYTNMPMNRNKGVALQDSISLDRLDPRLGYVKGNVVFCMFSINSLKCDLSEKEFKQMLIGILPALQNYSEGKERN